jgi:hypothetical protein
MALALWMTDFPVVGRAFGWADQWLGCDQAANQNILPRLALRNGFA